MFKQCVLLEGVTFFKLKNYNTVFWYSLPIDQALSKSVDNKIALSFMTSNTYPSFDDNLIISLINYH